MGLLSRFQASRKPAAADPPPPPAPAPSPAPTPAARPTELWRRGDFQSSALGASDHAIRVRAREPLVVPAYVVEFVYGCEDFLPIEHHIARYAESHGWGPPELDALQRYLPALIEAGVLVSTAGLRAAVLVAKYESAPPLPHAIGVSTGGRRWELLHRCLESFHENLQAYGHATGILVSDNSADPADTERCREALRAWQAKTGAAVQFAGTPEKRAFIAELARAGACTPETGEFALLDPLGSRFSLGANRNALLLQEAGYLFSSLDDDVICRISPPPGSSGPAGPREDLSCFSDGDPFSRWLFPDRASAREAAPPCEADYLGIHHRLLGRTLADAFRAAPSVDFTDAGDFITRRITRQPPRIRATFLGHVGDPGIPTSAYYLYYRRENRRRLVQSEELYRAVFPSRSVVTVVPQPRVGDATVSPGMAMGLDHRQFLPPFFPILHAEDFSYGSALWQCCPDAVLGHLPFAVAHEPPEGRAIFTPEDLCRERPFIIWEYAHLLRRVILNASLPVDGTAERRTILLGRQLQQYGELPPGDFLEFLRQQALGEAGERLEYLHRQLATDDPAPAYWLDDVEALMDHLRDSASAPGAEIPLDLPSTRTPEQNREFIQQTFTRYGQLLQAWPAIVEAAQHLRDKGQSLMPFLT